MPGKMLGCRCPLVVGLSGKLFVFPGRSPLFLVFGTLELFSDRSSSLDRFMSKAAAGAGRTGLVREVVFDPFELLAARESR